MTTREEALYATFGNGDLTSPDDPDLAVNWPTGGVMIYAPRGDRRGWHYVTHGLSDTFDYEIAMSTPKRCEWPSMMLFEMARYLLLDDDAAAILPGDRLPTGAFAKVSPGTRLSHIFATTSTEYAPSLAFDGKECSIVHVVGATASEIERVKKEGGAFGTKVLCETLRRLGVGFMTDPARAPATDAPTFDEIWRQCALAIA
jgi:hypothetical protein